MKLAVGLPNAIPGVSPTELMEWARTAEALGYSALGTIGRTVFDSYEELIVLAAAAAVTERIQLITTVLVAPPRETSLLAKQAASLAALSRGRFTLGMGVGWRRDDYDAAGVPFERRGRALERQIASLREIWAGESPHRIGPHSSIQAPPDILLGGGSPRALDRIGRLADAFLAQWGPVSSIRAHADAVREAATRAGRQPPRLLAPAYFALGPLESKGRANMETYYRAGGDRLAAYAESQLLTTPESVRSTLEGLAEAGVDEAVLWPATSDPAQLHQLAELAHDWLLAE